MKSPGARGSAVPCLASECFPMVCWSVLDRPSALSYSSSCLLEFSAVIFLWRIYITLYSLYNISLNSNIISLSESLRVWLQWANAPDFYYIYIIYNNYIYILYSYCHFINQNFILKYCKLGVVIHACNLSVWKAKAGSWVWANHLRYRILLSPRTDLFILMRFLQPHITITWSGVELTWWRQ